MTFNLISALPTKILPNFAAFIQKLRRYEKDKEQRPFLSKIYSS